MALVILFAVIGRSTHDEAIFAGLPKTVWPFAVGLVVGWAAAYALACRRGPRRDDGFNPMRVWPTGVLVWASTLAIGMVLRALSGQGVAASFVVVAAVALALFLIGWRAAVRALPRSIR
nr:DUF3054 domain-containing protein [Nocardia bovistercoris]